MNVTANAQQLLSTLTVAELRQQLSHWNLKRSGRKADLIARLTAMSPKCVEAALYIARVVPCEHPPEEAYAVDYIAEDGTRRLWVGCTQCGCTLKE